MSANPRKSEIILKLYARLRQSPCTIDVLEDWKRKNGYDFSLRTLYRYMDELSRNLKIKGEEIEVINGEYNKKTWKLVSASGNKELTTYDINTFYLLKTFVPQSILKYREDFFEKLEKQFYNQHSLSKFERSVDAFTLGLKSTSFYEANYTEAQQDIIEQCIWAIQNNKKIIVTSLVPQFDLEINKVNNGDIFLPLLLLNHRGLLHIVAYNQSEKRIVIIGMQAIQSITLTNQKFNPKKYYKEFDDYNLSHFGITQNINKKLYKIELEFDKGTGHYISCFFWHATQEFEELPNGKFRLRLHCGINGELVGWVAQWLNNVRVVNPAILKNLVNNCYKESIDLNSGKSMLHKQTFWK